MSVFTDLYYFVIHANKRAKKKVTFYFLPNHLSEVSSTLLSLEVIITGIALFV